MDRKVKIIAGFVEKLKKRDEEYMSALQKFGSESESTVEKMHRQYEILRESYKSGLEQFEQFLNDRYKDKRNGYKNNLSNLLKKEKEEEQREHTSRLTDDDRAYKEIESQIFERMQV